MVFQGLLAEIVAYPNLKRYMILLPGDNIPKTLKATIKSDNLFSASTNAILQKPYTHN